MSICQNPFHLEENLEQNIFICPDLYALVLHFFLNYILSWIYYKINGNWSPSSLLKYKEYDVKLKRKKKKDYFYVINGWIMETNSHVGLFGFPSKDCFVVMIKHLWGFPVSLLWNNNYCSLDFSQNRCKNIDTINTHVSGTTLSWTLQSLKFAKAMDNSHPCFFWKLLLFMYSNVLQIPIFIPL